MVCRFIKGGKLKTLKCAQSAVRSQILQYCPLKNRAKWEGGSPVGVTHFHPLEKG